MPLPVSLDHTRISQLAAPCFLWSPAVCPTDSYFCALQTEIFLKELVGGDEEKRGNLRDLLGAGPMGPWPTGCMGYRGVQGEDEVKKGSGVGLQHQ